MSRGAAGDVEQRLKRWSGCVLTRARRFPGALAERCPGTLARADAFAPARLYALLPTGGVLHTQPLWAALHREGGGCAAQVRPRLYPEREPSGSFGGQAGWVPTQLCVYAARTHFDVPPLESSHAHQRLGAERMTHLGVAGATQQRRVTARASGVSRRVVTTAPRTWFVGATSATTFSLRSSQALCKSRTPARGKRHECERDVGGMLRAY